MTTRDIAVLTFRLVGAVTLFELLAWSPAVATYYLRNTDQSFGSLLVLGFVPAVLPLLLGVLLVLFPGTVADRVVGTSGLDEQANAEPMLFRVCFATLGVYFVVRGVSMVGYEGASLAMIFRLAPPGDSGFVPIEQWAGLLAAVLEVAFGLALVLGREGIVRSLRQIRGRS